MVWGYGMKWLQDKAAVLVTMGEGERYEVTTGEGVWCEVTTGEGLWCEVAMGMLHL